MNATDLQHLWCYDVTQWGSHMFCGTLPTSWMCESERTFTLKRKLRWTKPKDDTERTQQSGSLKPSHLVPRRSMLRKVATWSAQLCRMALFDWKILWSSRISVRTTLRTSCTIESSDAFKTWKKWNMNHETLTGADGLCLLWRKGAVHHGHCLRCLWFPSCRSSTSIFQKPSRQLRSENMMVNYWSVPTRATRWRHA